MLPLLFTAACGPPDYQAVLDESLVDWEFPGITAVILEGDEQVFSGSAGVSNALEETPMRAQDRFRLGSLTKPFTAVVIHQLDQENLIALDDPVSAWVAGVPRGDEITLRQLVLHTSGIGDYVDYGRYWDNADSPWELDELLELAFIEEKGYPGERGYYTNAGYILLGLAIEAATGESWESQIQARIIEPLGLADTGWFDQGAEPVHGYERYGEVLVDTTLHSHSENSWAAGALVSNAHDVAAFSVALWGGELLDAAHVDLWLVPDPTTGSTDWFRTQGLRLDVVDGEVNLGHMGKGVGYRSDWSTRPDRDVTVVTMHNGSWRRARDLSNRLFDEHRAR